MSSAARSLAVLSLPGVTPKWEMWTLVPQTIAAFGELG
jgi:hypothetical protein